MALRKRRDEDEVEDLGDEFEPEEIEDEDSDQPKPKIKAKAVKTVDEEETEELESEDEEEESKTVAKKSSPKPKLVKKGNKKEDEAEEEETEEEDRPVKKVAVKKGGKDMATKTTEKAHRGTKRSEGRVGPGKDTMVGKVFWKAAQEGGAPVKSLQKIVNEMKEAKTAYWVLRVVRSGELSGAKYKVTEKDGILAITNIRAA